MLVSSRNMGSGVARRGIGSPRVDAHPHAEEDAMRFGVHMRLAALASLALFLSGQLCMLTTCVPRLRDLAAGSAHACCHALPGEHAPSGPDRGPAPSGAPAGAMPCDQASSLADAPTLAAPQPLAVAPAWVPLNEPTRILLPVALELRERDTGPVPGRHSPAPSGLRAPPIA